ncbi:hypothetical protein [Alteromonas sp. ASW11-130]|uniref:hypothetical protein n=1 Tax=Alteromonas sp. ASW11-130 TaxID=3015775 RepID=UPI002241AEDF|nr:hypothetical protein [Alteromonas sp. ASW11-130]
MKQNVDVQVVLATPADMEDFFDDASEAAEQFNFIVHVLYDRADEDISASSMDRLFQYCWETWHRYPDLTDIDEDELIDWVDHTLATWDDAGNQDNL